MRMSLFHGQSMFMGEMTDFFYFFFFICKAESFYYTTESNFSFHLSGAVSDAPFSLFGPAISAFS